MKTTVMKAVMAAMAMGIFAAASASAMTPATPHRVDAAHRAAANGAQRVAQIRARIQKFMSRFQKALSVWGPRTRRFAHRTWCTSAPSKKASKARVSCKTVSAAKPTSKGKPKPRVIVGKVRFVRVK